MTTTVKQVISISESAVRAILASAILFLVLLAALLMLKPEIDPAWRFISEYSIGHHGWMMVSYSLWFIVMAWQALRLRRQSA